jgi:opacity protein-like surface antigen
MKRLLVLRGIWFLAVAALLAGALLAHTGIVCAEDNKKQDEWQFTLTPYLWAPSISGNMKFSLPVGSGEGKADVSSSDYLENLQFAAMLSFEAAKGRWSILSDFLYFEFSDSNRDATVPGLGVGSGFAINADTGLKALVFSMAGAYTVFKNQNGNFDVLAGLRYANVEGKVDLNINGPLPAGWRSSRFSESEDFIDPIIGFRGKLLLGKNWFMPYYFDIGGFSVDSDLTLQAYAGIGYRFTDWFSLSLGYRYLYYDFGNTKLVEDITLNGGVLGFVFNF